MTLSRPYFADSITQSSGMAHALGRLTTLIDGMALHGPDVDDRLEHIQLHKCQRLIGELRYIADFKRPYFSFIVGKLGAVNHAPTQGHVSMLNSTIRYFRVTRHYGLTYNTKSKEEERFIEVHSDADFAGHSMDRR